MASSLEKLPFELLADIYELLPPREATNLSVASRTLNGVYKKDKDKLMAAWEAPFKNALTPSRYKIWRTLSRERRLMKLVNAYPLADGINAFISETYPAWYKAININELDFLIIEAYIDEHPLHPNTHHLSIPRKNLKGLKPGLNALRAMVADNDPYGLVCFSTKSSK